MTLTDPQQTALGLAPPPVDFDLGGRDGEQDQNPLHRLHVMLRGRYLLVAVLALLLGGAGTFIGWKTGKQTYLSRGTIRILPVLPSVLKGGEGSAMPMFDTFADAQVAYIGAQRVLQLAMSSPEWAQLGRGQTDQALQEFSEAVRVYRRGEIVWVEFEDADPNAAMTAVQAIIRAYNSLEVEGGLRSDERILTVLNQRKQALEGQYNVLRSEIRTLAEPFGTEDLSSLISMKGGQVGQWESLLQQVDLEMKMLQVKRELMATRDVSRMTPEEIGQADPRMGKLMVEREELAAEMARSTLLENHPSMVRRRAQLDLVQKEILAYAEQWRRRQTALIDSGELSQQERLAELQQEARKAELEKNLQAVRSELLGYSQVNMKLTAKRDEAGTIQRQLKETEGRIDQITTESRVAGRVVIVSLGERPLGPHRDTRISRAGTGAFAGAAMAAAIVLLISLSDRRLRSADDARLTMSRNMLLGVLPSLPDDLSDPEQAGLAAHCVHQIRTRLQIWSGAGRHNVFAVTSPMAGTGKTSLTLSLGISFAAAQSRTLIIDCDLVGGGLSARVNTIIRRKLGQILRASGLVTDAQVEEALSSALTNRRKLGETLLEMGYVSEKELQSALTLQEQGPSGLLDALLGGALEECICETGIPNLAVLPLGNASGRHAGMLSPSALRQIIAQARKTFDTIIIDTGPIPGSLEAAAVASAVDGVIMTVSRGEQRPLAEHSVGYLKAIGARLAGFVFNRAHEREVTPLGTSARSVSGQTVSGIAPYEAREGQESAKFGPVARAVASYAPVGKNGASRNKQTP